MDGLDTLEFQSEYELQCNEVLGWRRRAPTVEGFTKEVKKFNQGLFPNLFFFWSSLLVPSTVLSLKCSMLSIFDWFPGECSLRPIDGGDHPEDCSGQVPLTALRHHVRPAGRLLEPENSCESCEPW